MRALVSDCRGAAAAEMAMVVPLLLVLLFGCFELGNYFWNEHYVVKSVRDGARYAARQPITAFACPAGTIDPVTETRIKEVTRTGAVAGGLPRIPSWDNSEVTVTVGCQATPTGYYASGIYSGLPGGARTVTVAAAVPYPSLFGMLGFDAVSLTLGARAHAAVMGI